MTDNNNLTDHIENIIAVAGDIPKRFSLTADELDSVEGSETDEQQRQLLEQIVIDKDLPVAMRTIQVRNIKKNLTGKGSKKIMQVKNVFLHQSLINKCMCRVQCGIVKSVHTSSLTVLTTALCAGLVCSRWIITVLG